MIQGSGLKAKVNCLEVLHMSKTPTTSALTPARIYGFKVEKNIVYFSRIREIAIKQDDWKEEYK